METKPVARIESESLHPRQPQVRSKNASQFKQALDAAIIQSAPAVEAPRNSPATLTPPSAQLCATQPARSAVPTYAQQADPIQDSKPMSDWEKYKDDQLLRNPGGDRYSLAEKKVVSEGKDRESFSGRIKKDLSDAFGNIKNLFKNFFMGSKILYRGKNNEILEGSQRGFLRACGDFVKNLVSALTFGYYHPGREKGPQGVAERVGHSLSKVKEALVDDLVGGTTGSLNRMAKNMVLAGWNLVEVIPDATVGNFAHGKKLTTSIFDNGQVLVEYLTDVVPSGEAWLRVHASSIKELQAPIIYNLKMPEHHKEDVRWRYVRNTPFRKSIETVGALLADIAALAFVGQTGFSSKEPNSPP